MKLMTMKLRALRSWINLTVLQKKYNIQTTQRVVFSCSFLGGDPLSPAQGDALTNTLMSLNCLRHRLTGR